MEQFLYFEEDGLFFDETAATRLASLVGRTLTSQAFIQSPQDLSITQLLSF